MTHHREGANPDNDRRMSLADQVAEKKHLEKIIPIRMSAENWGQIKEEADRMGIGVSTLTRIWVMEYLGKLKNGTYPDDR